MLLSSRFHFFRKSGNQKQAEMSLQDIMPRNVQNVNLKKSEKTYLISSHPEATNAKRVTEVSNMIL